MAPLLAFVFPGQGSQRVGMLDALPSNPLTTGLLEEAEDLSGMALRDIARQGPDEALADTRAAQPLLFIAGLAWARELEGAGVSPHFVAGHSLGEIAALTFAGVMSAETGIELVSARARIMSEVAQAVAGGMTAVLGLSRDVVADIAANIEGVWVANDNSATQTIISGTQLGIERATEALHAAGARKVVPLSVAGPFHSPLMAPAREAFAEVVSAVEFSDARVPVLQNTEPSPATDAATIRERLLDQITAPVRWRETMDALVANDVTVMIETGPGAVLSGLARRIEGVSALSVEAEGMARLTEVYAT